MRDAYRRRPQDFKRRVVCIVTNKKKLVIEEQRWLDMIKPEECGIRYYNKTLKSTTPSMRGRKHSEKTKQKMSLAQKGKVVSENQKVLISNSLKEHFSNEDVRKKQSDKIKTAWRENRKVFLEGIKKGSNSRVGKERPKEVKEKISKSHLGKKKSEETRQRMADSHKGKKHHSQEHLDELSKRMIGNKFASVPRSEKFKKRVSDSMKKFWEEKRK